MMMADKKSSRVKETCSILEAVSINSFTANIVDNTIFRNTWLSFTETTISINSKYFAQLRHHQNSDFHSCIAVHALITRNECLKKVGSLGDVPQN
jgi:hypothetical protein